MNTRARPIIYYALPMNPPIYRPRHPETTFTPFFKFARVRDVTEMFTLQVLGTLTMLLASSRLFVYTYKNPPSQVGATASTGLVG